MTGRGRGYKRRARYPARGYSRMMSPPSDDSFESQEDNSETEMETRKGRAPLIFRSHTRANRERTVGSLRHPSPLATRENQDAQFRNPSTPPRYPSPLPPTEAVETKMDKNSFQSESTQSDQIPPKHAPPNFDLDPRIAAAKESSSSNSKVMPDLEPNKPAIAAAYFPDSDTTTSPPLTDPED